MYIFKNALKSISRTKGRNFSIFIPTIIFFIVSCTLATVSISAWKTTKDVFKTTELTATVVINNEGAAQGGERRLPANLAVSLTYDEIKEYGSSSHLKSYYYYLTSNVRANIKPYESNNDAFAAIGYSSYEAMTNFVNGISEIIFGQMFEFNENYKCLISAEVASSNNLNVGDKISIYNPNNKNEVYEFTICGIYLNHLTDIQSNQFIPSSSSYNNILMSYDTLDTIIKKSYVKNVVIDQKDENAVMTGRLTSRFLLKSPKSADGFLKDLREKGLGSSYTIQTNINSIQDSLLPVYYVMADTANFLFVFLAAGALIVALVYYLQIKRRKSLIGTLSLMGMKRKKIFLQFAAEILIITLVAFLIGSLVAAVISESTANLLLDNQIKAFQNRQNQSGRNRGQGRSWQNQGSRGRAGEGFSWQAITGTSYVSQINTGLNILIVLSMVGIMILINLTSGTAAAAVVYRSSLLEILHDQIYE